MLKGVEVYSAEDEEGLPGKYGYTYMQKDDTGRWWPVLRWEMDPMTLKGKTIGYEHPKGILEVREVSSSPPRCWSDVVQIVKVFRHNLVDMEVSGL